MSRASRRTSLAAIPLCATLVHAVAVSDFRPTLHNVPDPCGSVYMEDIPGCKWADFKGSSGCSSECLAGIMTITDRIQYACNSFSAPGSVIELFQQGQGIEVVCHVKVVTMSDSNTASTAAIGESTMVLSSSAATPTSELIFDTNSAPPPAASTSTTSSEAAILTATGSPTLSSSSAPSSAPSQAPSTDASSSTMSTLTSVSSSSNTPSSTTTSQGSSQTQSDGNDGEGGDPFSPQGAAGPSASIGQSYLTGGLLLLVALVASCS